jgi:hypothetical protein
MGLRSCEQRSSLSVCLCIVLRACHIPSEVEESLNVWPVSV